MTDKEKLEKIKKLADDMYYAAANLGPTVGSGERLRKTMEEYHKFIIHEFNEEEPTIPDIVDEHFWEMLGEEPVSEKLEKAAVEAFKQIVDSDKNSFLEIFKDGANWQKQQIMKDAITGQLENGEDYLRIKCLYTSCRPQDDGMLVKFIIIK